MTADDREREMRLKSAEMHEVMPAETIEIDVDIFPGKNGNFTAAIKDTGWTLNRSGDMVLLSDQWGEILMYDHEISIVIALLTRARELMGGV
jgi:hypothetical protein